MAVQSMMGLGRRCLQGIFTIHLKPTVLLWVLKYMDVLEREEEEKVAAKGTSEELILTAILITDKRNFDSLTD